MHHCKSHLTVSFILLFSKVVDEPGRAKEEEVVAEEEGVTFMFD